MGDFKTKCPSCGKEGGLYVVEATVIMKSKLEEDGFIIGDRLGHTTDEKVLFDFCNTEHDLGILTN